MELQRGFEHAVEMEKEPQKTPKRHGNRVEDMQEWDPQEVSPQTSKGKGTLNVTEINTEAPKEMLRWIQHLPSKLDFEELETTLSKDIVNLQQALSQLMVSLSTLNSLVNEKLN